MNSPLLQDYGLASQPVSDFGAKAQRWRIPHPPELFSRFVPLQDLQFLTQFYHAAFRQHAAKIYVRIDKAIAPKNRTGIDHRVAADLGPVTDNRTKFRKPGRDVALLRGNHDLGVVELHVRQDHAGAEMRFESEDRVPNVIEVWDLGFVEDDAVLEFARIAHDDAVADHDVLAHITTAADLTIFADPRRALWHGSLFGNRAA